MRTLYLRADGNDQMGLGHVVRTLSLGAMFTPLTPVTLFTKWPTDYICNMAGSLGISVCSLNPEKHSDFLDLVAGESVVALDGYSFTTNDEQALRNKNARVVTISDDAERLVSADVVINHGINADQLTYKSTSDCKYLLGPKYALLRPSLLAAAQNAERKKYEKETLDVLICFGGADPLDLSRRYLTMLSQIETIAKIHIIVGAAYQHAELLKRTAENVQCDCKISVAVTASKLQRYLAEVDLALVPCSGILLEALALKTSVITGFYVDNQRSISEYLQTKGILNVVGDLRSATIDLSVLENSLSDKYKIDLVDGKSKDRIVSALMTLFNE